MSKGLFWLVAFATTAACAERLELSSLEAPSFTVRGQLKTGEFRPPWVGEVDGMVRGELTASGRTALEFVNLNCLGLELAEGRRDDGVYVDSPAHVFVEGFKSEPDGVVRADVYWVFSGMGEVSPGDLKGSRLFLRHPEASCAGMAAPVK